MAARAEYHANLFKLSAGAFSDLRRAASEWGDLDYFDQGDVLEGVMLAGGWLSELEDAASAGELSEPDRARLRGLKAEYTQILQLAERLERTMSPAPTKEEYEAMVAADRGKDEAA